MNKPTPFANAMVQLIGSFLLLVSIASLVYLLVLSVGALAGFVTNPSTVDFSVAFLVYAATYSLGRLMVKVK